MKKLTMMLLTGLCFQQTKAQWLESGNSITSGDFLGTNNNEDLVFKTNGTEKMRLTSGGTLNLNTFYMSNNGAFQSTLNSNGVAKMDMGFAGVGYVDFTLHTGSGQRPNVLHMTGDGYVGIGTGAPAYKFDVNGDMNIASGQAYRLGGVPILSNPGVENVFVGARTGLIGIYSTFVGESAGANNTYYGIKNTFLGYNSGLFNTDGNNNTFIGADAGYFNMLGSKNVFIGMRCGYNASSGYENTFLGNEAGYSNVDGYANTFVGYQSGYSTNAPTSHDPYGNSFFGHQSGFSNTSGQGNVFLGKSAGYGNQTGVFNVAIGLRAGESLTSGARNVAIGGEAGNSMLSTAADNVLIGYNSGNSTDGQRNCYIGRDVTSVGDYNVVIGGMGTSSGTGTVRGIVAIGSGSSVGRISTSSNVNGSMAIGYNAFSYGLDNSAAIGSSASVYTANTMALGGVGATIGSGGNTALTVVINKTARTTGQNYRLEIDGDAFQSTGTLWTTSDIRLKKDIKDFNNALNIIERLHPVSYRYKDDLGTAAPKEEQIGFIAQELEEVLPEMVRTHEDGSKAVNYQNLFGVLTQGIKEQQQQIVENKESVENELIAVKEQNTQLVSVIDELKARLDALEQKSTGGSVTPLADSRMQQARLEQNEPNPFTDNTVIKYWVPQTAKVATIIIRSDKALEVMKFSIEHKGNGNIIVSGNTLTVGGYNCELYVDGKLADSKKMILVK